MVSCEWAQRSSTVLHVKLTFLRSNSEATLIPAVVIVSGRDEITVEWDAFFAAKFIRYRSERGRAGD